MSYYDYAEDDYLYLEECIKSGIYDNALASLAQNTCERYLKSIIVTSTAVKENSYIMRAHSLKTLFDYVLENLPDFEINAMIMLKADGLYIATRYPGDDSFFASKQDVLDAFAAVEETKNAVDKYLNEHKLNDLEALSLFRF